jgi:hypothetical protein
MLSLLTLKVCQTFWQELWFVDRALKLKFWVTVDVKLITIECLTNLVTGTVICW